MELQKLDLVEIRNAIRDWCDVLAEKDYAKAAQMLHPVPRMPAYDRTFLKRCLGEYSRAWREGGELDELIPQVTRIEQMNTESEFVHVYFKAHFGTCEVEYDMPLNGEWSDLTAQFSLWPHGSVFLMGLNDLHVL